MTVEQILARIAGGLVEYSPTTGRGHLFMGGEIPAGMVRYLSKAGLLYRAGPAGGEMHWLSLTDAGWDEHNRHETAQAAA